MRVAVPPSGRPCRPRRAALWCRYGPPAAEGRAGGDAEVAFPLVFLITPIPYPVALAPSLLQSFFESARSWRSYSPIRTCWWGGKFLPVSR
jgi:hypothetical protein